MGPLQCSHFRHYLNYAIVGTRRRFSSPAPGTVACALADARAIAALVPSALRSLYRTWTWAGSFVDCFIEAGLHATIVEIGAHAARFTLGRFGHSCAYAASRFAAI